MESRISRIFLRVSACLLLASSMTCYGESEPEVDEAVPIIEPFIVRADLNEADIDSENFEVGVYWGQISMEEFGTTDIYGIRGTFHATEDFFLEANYAQTTLVRPTSAVLTRAVLFADDKVTMYNLSLGFNVFPGEVFIGDDWAFNSALYIIAGGGITEFNGEDEFTVNVGIGYRLILTDWLAFHVGVRDHIFTRSILGVESRSQNIDMHAGVSFFF